MASRSRITRLPSHLSPLRRPRLNPPPPFRQHARPSSSLPRVTNTSVWTSMIPKFLRNRDRKPKSQSQPKSKEWNPATFFIFIFLLIGSQAIRMLGLRNDFANFNRSADAKMELLREVIGRMEKGEKVDVEKLLGAAGAGGAGEEREWEEVLQEIEKEDSLWRKSQGETAETSQQKPATAAIKEPEETGTSKPDDKPPSQPEGQKPRPFSFY